MGQHFLFWDKMYRDKSVKIVMVATLYLYEVFLNLSL